MCNECTDEYTCWDCFVEMIEDQTNIKYVWEDYDEV